MEQKTEPVTANLNKIKFDKIFIIDINPGNDQISKELVMGKIARVIKNASIYQNVIILSHSNMDLLKKLVKDIGIRNGFIVSDHGARIYDISRNKILYQSSLGKDEVGAIVHYAMMQNLLVLASSSGKEYAYSLNLLNAVMLGKKHYIPLSFTNDYNKFSKFINTATIHSLLIFHKERSEMIKGLTLFDKVIEEWNVKATISQATYFIVNNVVDSKYNAILKIMEILNINNVGKIYYYAINSIDEKCVRAFKHHLIHQDVAFNSDYIDRLNIQASTDMMASNISRVFFSNVSNLEHNYNVKSIIDTERLNQIMNEAKNTRKVY